MMRSDAPIILLLAIIVACGRLAAPAGWMPASSGIGFTLCSGHARASVDTPSQLPLQSPGKDNDCAFAVGSLAGDAPPAPILSVFPRVAILVAAPILAPGYVIGRGIGQRAEPATGPPTQM
jgi:hypothetical protein